LSDFLITHTSAGYHFTAHAQIANDITQKTPASFEPSIDYVVTKIPRFAFEKFPGSKPELTTMMKSVGEVMAIGRTWQESMQKALRGMETGLDGWALPKNYKRMTRDALLYCLRVPNPERLVAMKQAFEDGLTVAELFELTKIDPWWLEQLSELHTVSSWLGSQKLGDLTADDWVQLKKRGFSDQQIARAIGKSGFVHDAACYSHRAGKLGKIGCIAHLDSILSSGQTSFTSTT
jgi:carbamoyl-phosphate synthase large subunit